MHHVRRHHKNDASLGPLQIIDDPGLFADGRIADLVIHDTIIFDFAGISLCIDKSRFLVSGTILHPPLRAHRLPR
jgi:hypothetical protein